MIRVAASVLLPVFTAVPVAVPFPSAPVASLSLPSVAPLALSTPFLPASVPLSAASAVLPLMRREGGAGSFDWDDNVMKGLPTKIFLYRIGTNEELAVSTVEYAELRAFLGKDKPFRGGNMRDYEVRPAGGSFRRFLDGPNGENYFLEDIQEAIRTLPPSAWQGPSWAAFVDALSTPEGAARTAIITARRHSPEKLHAALAWLKSEGWLAHLPPVANLIGVGGTLETAARKVDAQAAILDAFAADPNGPASVGFSDDDWTNYAAMRDGLRALLAENPARWRGLKIVIFYTAAHDPLHAPEKLVLSTGA